MQPDLLDMLIQSHYVKPHMDLFYFTFASLVFVDKDPAMNFGFLGLQVMIYVKLTLKALNYFYAILELLMVKSDQSACK